MSDRFIEITRKLDGFTGDTVERAELINVRHIVKVTGREQGGSYILTVGDTYQVREAYDDLKKALQTAAYEPPF